MAKKSDFYRFYTKNKKNSALNENCKYVKFSYTGMDYSVFISKRRASKRTHIVCGDDGTVKWVQFYLPFGGMSSPNKEENVLIKPIFQKNTVTIIVIKGKPAIIKGLDTGIFISASGTAKSSSDIYVMSEAAFKYFTPQI